MNLSGRWKGKYKYGDGYPDIIKGKSEPFEFDIRDDEGKIQGNCIDEIVKAVPGNSSAITGTFRDGLLIFSKKYRYQLFLDADGSRVQSDNEPSGEIHYAGHLKKRLFSGKPYFKGEWQINTEWTDEEGHSLTSSCGGTWEMTKEKPE